MSSQCPASNADSELPRERPAAVIVTSNFWPERTGIGQVNTELARYLMAHGVDVHVVTGYPYYPEWKIYPGYSRGLRKAEMHEGITIHRSWHYVRPNPRAGGRILHEMTLAFFALPNLIRSIRRADTLFIVSPDLTFAFVAGVLARLWRREFNLVVQDVMPDAASELGLLDNRGIVFASRAMARYLYNRAASIRTLGEGMRRRIAAQTRNPEKISVVPNAVDVRELAPPPGASTAFRSEFFGEATFAVVHSGNMGWKQDLGILLDAAGNLVDASDIRFFVFGDGAAKGEFLRQRDSRQLANVMHFGFQDRARVAPMLREANAVVISQMKEVVDIAVPSKLQVAMAAGAMIIAACAPDSETARIVRESGGGIVVPAGDGAALAAALVEIRDGRVETATFRQRAASYAARNYDADLLYGPICRSVFESAGSRDDRAS